MDKQIAEFSVIASYRAGRELIGLLETAHAHCSEEDYKDLKSKVATAITEINAISRWAFKDHPELEAAVEDRIEKYGRVG